MILESKLKIPKEEVHIIDKPEIERIFEDTALPCIVVKAMSGSGKTTVCAMAAEKYIENVRWYTLDMTDNDKECFIMCMEELWKTVDGKAADGKGTIQFRVLELAYRAQKWDRGTKLHIILDNFQVISSESVFQILSLLQQYAEKKVSFVFLTNQRPPKFFLAILAKGKGQILSVKHLKFTQEEVCHYFGDDGDLSEDVLKQITEDLCGWPFGIRYVIGYLHSIGQYGNLDWNRILRESFLSDYLDEILETNCTKQMQLFLKQTAVFDEFSWEMCQEILTEQITCQDFEEMMSGLVFFYKLPRSKVIWQCSRAFRIYLCRMLSNEEKKGLYKKAALWYQEKEEMIKIRCFGTFQVTMLRDGRELAWRTRKGKELFAYLLDIRGKAVERHQLLEILWQDEIPANAVAMLHNMIYNIRKELSAYSLETILSYENKRYRLNMDGISCDVCQIQKMAALVENRDIVELKKEVKSFIDYWGSYLGDIDSIWVDDRRAYYDEIYKEGCWMLAEQFAKENEPETALLLYENILVLEPYSEQTVEKILILYGQQKKWDKLKKCYQDFTEMLEKDLGIAPGEEVLAAYHHYLC